MNQKKFGGRSVILFNTWNGSPPQNVPRSNMVASDADIAERGPLCGNRADWSEVFSMSSSRDELSSCPADYVGMSDRAKIWLIGNELRRGQPLRTVHLAAPVALRGALSEESMVRRPASLRAIIGTRLFLLPRFTLTNELTQSGLYYTLLQGSF